MKKLFIAAMALAAMVSCSKDDGVSVLESSKKAVSITIANGASATRAVVEESLAVDTNDGGTATIQDQATAAACATADELVLLLANDAGTVEEAYALGEYQATNNTYTFHNVSESVTQVAVVRNIVDGEANTDADSYLGSYLTTYRDAAANVDKMENIDITDIDLYVAAKLENTDTCVKLPADEHNTEWTYQLFTASVTVAPTIARVEITGIACDVADCSETDHATAHVSHVLGGTTLAAAQGQLVSGGYDELALGKLTWGAKDEYTFDLTGNTLKGIYAGEGNKTARPAENYTPAETVAEGETADDVADAIVWNIDPTAEVPQIGEGKNPMVLEMVASAYDYKVVNTKKTLSIGFGDAVEAFEPGKIYRFSINFGENNLDESNEAICVQVEVEITDWVVVPVTPVFGNN